MKRIRLKFICLTLLYIPLAGYTQNPASNSTVYEAQVFGSVASGEYTPFWMTNNRYGVVPLEANNGYLNAGVYHQQTFGKGFQWGAGINAIAAVPRYRNAYIQQLYGEIGYKCLLLSIGSKERYRSIVDKRISTGDVLFSTNARPIPEINLSIPHFTSIPLTKGWLQVKGDFAIGRSLDTKYLKHVSNAHQIYTEDVLWHHKSLYLRIQDTHHHFPLSAVLGIEHVAQWGGNSTNPKIGEQPHAFKDFLRVIAGKEGGGEATVSDQINVLGAHHIAYILGLRYTRPDWSLHAYHQHLCADKSGMELYNGADGLWGLQLDLHRFRWINKVLIEHFTTLNQSGPFHYITFDHDKHPGRGGGADNYYNNGEYNTGYSYFNRGLGSPLVIAPEYNRDGSLGFKSTRVRDWHLGMEGDISSHVSYRFLFTWMQGWGTPTRPLLKKIEGISLLVDIVYTHPRLTGWTFTGTLAGDTGDVTGDNGIGIGFTISKRGLLKSWDK